MGSFSSRFFCVGFCEAVCMRQRTRDTEVLSIIEKYMPDAIRDEKLVASAEIWDFFDGLYELFQTLENSKWFDRDKIGESDSLKGSGSLTTE